MKLLKLLKLSAARNGTLVDFPIPDPKAECAPVHPGSCIYLFLAGQCLSHATVSQRVPFQAMIPESV